MPGRAERSERDGCDCDTLAESSVRKCPECGRVETTAVPFTHSGRSFRSCRSDGLPVPVLTDLSPTHFKDERGYTVCLCGYVFDEMSFGSESSPSRMQAVQMNHYYRVGVQYAGFVPNGRRSYRRLLSDVESKQLKALAGVLADADALCSHLDMRADVKAEATRALEAYFTDPSRNRYKSIRVEAIVCAMVEQVATRFGLLFDSDKLWNAYSVDTNRQRMARSRVTEWFHESYWKGEK